MAKGDRDWMAGPRRLAESLESLWDRWVDPAEAWAGEEGEAWSLVSGEGTRTRADVGSEETLGAIRRRCRALAARNEFAINGHENRISYIVGRGHVYRASVRKGTGAPEALAAAAQREIDEFVRENSWRRRQQEIVRRCDRDGEAFLRFFPGIDGRLKVRFVEPDQVSTPDPLRSEPSASFGIATDRYDVEEVQAYYIDGEATPAEEIQHRKANVDFNVKRGAPLFYPVMDNLRRAEKLLRNMSVVAEIQAAIALIRKHHGRRGSTVKQFVEAGADGRDAGGEPIRRYGPGTILDADATIEYDFPAGRINAASYVAVLQAELRAIAARLVMPEFMLTSDASNANYASTLVAEGPAHKMFERLQAEQAEWDRAVMRRVLENGVRVGRLTAETLEAIEVEAAGPQLCTRDQLKDAHARKIEYEAGLLSRQTWSRLAGLDYDQEQDHRRRGED